MLKARALALFVLFSATIASAQQRSIPGLIWTDRADLEKQILRKWDGDIRSSSIKDPQDLARVIAAAPEGRLVRAAAAGSFGEMIRRLSGTNPARSIPLLPVAAVVPPPVTDLTFVSTTPCRAIDTRLSSVGKLTAGSTHSFFTNSVSAGPTAWADQGGDSSGCPDIPLDPPAVMITIAAAAPEANGNARVWAYGSTEPVVSNLNFTTGVNIANTTLTPTCVGCGPDINIKVTQNVHIIADVVGYFRAKDKSLDAHVLSAPIFNSAQVTLGGAQGISMPDAGNGGFVINTVLPQDYTPGTDLTVRFIFTSTDTGCDIDWGANAPFFRYGFSGPAIVVSVVPTAQPVTVNIVSGQPFSAAATISGPMNPSDVITHSWSRLDVPADTCTGLLTLRAVELFYE